MSVGRYVLFGGKCYYAMGGWNDKLESFGALAAAKNAALQWRVREDWMDDEDYAEATVVDWWHIVDMTTYSIVAGSAYQAYGADNLTVKD